MQQHDPPLFIEAMAARTTSVEQPFLGNSEHKVDAKGRVSIPADFRRVLEAGDPEWKSGEQPKFVLNYGNQKGKCIEGHTLTSMNAVMQETLALARDSEERRKRARAMAAQSEPMKVDPNGRIVLSERVREQFGISDKAIFVGMFDTFEIWDPEAYDKDQADLEGGV